MNDASARAAAASTGMNQSKCNADSMSNAARSKGVFVYDPPEQCQMMVICAGSPRAASTAHCMIAEHVIQHIMDSRKKIGRSKPEYVGYWNYHLHAVCSDGQPCPLYDAVTGDLAEFKQHVSSLPNLDGEEKDALRACISPEELAGLTFDFRFWFSPRSQAECMSGLHRSHSRSFRFLPSEQTDHLRLFKPGQANGRVVGHGQGVL